MSEQQYIVLWEARNELEAESLRALLEANGLGVVISPKRRTNFDGTLAAGPVEICVHQSDEQRAIEILEEQADPEHIDWDAVDVGEFEDPEPVRHQDELTLPGVVKMGWWVVLGVSALSLTAALIRWIATQFP